jgi:hypothetical protein
MMFRKVDRLFLSAGAMRCGTTWLYNMLREHPELYFTPQKELHFIYDYYAGSREFQSLELPIWDREYVTTPGENDESWYDRSRRLKYLFEWALVQLDHDLSYEYYHRLFSLRWNEKYSCDMSNLTSYLPERDLFDVKSRFDTVKVLYVMRDPLMRLWSHFVYNNERIGQPREFCESAWNKDAVIKWMNGENILVPKSSDYVEAIKKLGNVFGDDFNVLFYEDLVEDTLGSLRNIERFLEISEHKYSRHSLEKVVNFSAMGKEPWGLFIESVSPALKNQVDELSNYITPHPKWSKYENCS